MKPKPLPDAEDLRAAFSYDPETGALTRRRKVGRYPDTMGFPHRGYICTSFRMKIYQVHRIAWKIMTGSDPIDQIDHINGDGTDNRWVNLRECTAAQNRWNTGLSKRNHTGLRGAAINRKEGKWQAQITVGRKIKFLGLFATAEEAAAAYDREAKVLHGEFYREISS